MPSESEPSPSSVSEHSMPSLYSPADLASLDAEVTGEDRPDGGEGIEGASLHVGRSADDLHLATRTLDPAKGEAVRVRMLAALDDPGHHDILQPGRQGDHLFHGRATKRQVLHRRFDRKVEARRDVTEPFV